jgi:membrane protein implicated in regulation of membrane protease activity
MSFLAGAIHFHLPFRLSLHHHHGGGFQKGGGSHISWLNATTVMAFLAWFGGVGYILTRTSSFVALACLLCAVLAGLFAAAVVLKFMTKLMRASDAHLTDSDYRIEGSVGTVSVPIRRKGTGEIIFVQGGVRRSAGARSENGIPIEKNTEIVIARYDHGIAYVRRWDEFTR